MILKRRVALNGVHLDSLDERIIITGIDEAAGADKITATMSANGSGQRVVKKRRDTLDVTVKFTMAIKNDDMAARALLLETVNAWAAKGGWLTVNYRPDRRLGVVLAQVPGGGDQFNWANEYTIVFRAFAVPYWEDVAPATATSGTGSSGSMQITVPGSAETVADVTVVNKSGAAIAKVELTIGGKYMKFETGTILASGQSLVVDHPQTVNQIYFRATVSGSSVMRYRTGANDFTVQPGNVSISFSASRAVQVNVSVKGRYL
jgi:hypothetical protein